MAMLEVFCNASTAFLNHAEDICLWPTVAKLVSIHAGENGSGSTSGNKLQMDPNIGICSEFMEIKVYGLQVRQEFSQLIGQLPHNRCKNRYRDILPFDKCRATLDDGGDDGENYINASLVEGLSSCYTYIAAQGPLSGQSWDFWRLVLRYRCPAIVMLCDLVEAGRSKCSQYWPSEAGKPHTYGSVTVTLVEEEVLSSSQESPYNPICRTFEVYSQGDEYQSAIHCCKQYQMIGWPDHGVPPPSAITPLIDLAAQLTIVNPPSQSSGFDQSTLHPLLVHCSAGCGRTGVFISLHQTCALMKLNLLDSNILANGLMEMVKSLRYQRPSMVQTFDQYVFLYQLVGTLMRRVTRSCLRRLAKMGVSLDVESNPTSSPSPPPPKPPDPFRSSNGSLNKIKIPPQVAPGRYFATEVASGMVVANRSSDWAVLRRSARILSGTLPRPNQQLNSLISSPLLSTPKPQVSPHRRASFSADAPSIGLRKRTPPTSPRRETTVDSSNGVVDSSAVLRLDGVQKQLEQLVSSVEMLASPTSPPKPRRSTHRRQLSGSYDNINELAAEVSDSPKPLLTSTDRIVVDLSNLSPPPPPGVTANKLKKETVPQKENPLLTSQSILNNGMQVSPPPPAAPPRRRKRFDFANAQPQHHLSVAHLVLNNQSDGSAGESATLGRNSPSVGPSKVAVRNGHLKRQNSLILPAMSSSSIGALSSPATSNIHFNSLFNGSTKGAIKSPKNGQLNRFFKLQPTKPSLQPPVTLGKGDTIAATDNNPYASLGRFRSVAHLGQMNGTTTDVNGSDDYPASTPATPSLGIQQKQPTAGRSL